MRNLLVGLVLLFPVVASGQSSRWVQIWSNSAYHVTAYADSTTMTRQGTTVTGWFRLLYSVPQTDSGPVRLTAEPYDEFLARMEFDCAARQSRALDMVFRFQMRRLASTSVATPLSGVEPDTMKEALFNWACHSR